MKIITNHHWREVQHIWQLSDQERIHIMREFDYIDDWDSATFIKYRGDWIDLNDFIWIKHPYYGFGHQKIPAGFEDWDSYTSDSFFSGLVIKYHPEDSNLVRIGLYLA